MEGGRGVLEVRQALQEFEVNLGDTWYRIVNLTKKETISYSDDNTDDIKRLGGDSKDFVNDTELQDLMATTLPQLMVFLMAYGSWKGDDVKVVEDEMSDYDEYEDVTEKAIAELESYSTWLKFKRGRITMEAA